MKRRGIGFQPVGMVKVGVISSLFRQAGSLSHEKFTHALASVATV